MGTGSDGFTPLMLAVQNGHVQIVQALLKKAANTEVVSQTLGWTPLVLGISYGHTEVVKVLLEAGANHENGDKNGKTPLMLASLYGHLGVVKQLLAAGADYLKEDAHGKTAIELAMNQAVVHAILDFQNGLEDDNSVIQESDEDIQEVLPVDETPLPERNCVVCLKPRREKAFIMDCGHITACLRCAKQIFNCYKGPRKKCPTCKNPSKKSVKHLILRMPRKGG